MIKLTGYETFDSVYIDPKYIVSIERYPAMPDCNIKERTIVRLSTPVSGIILVLELPDTVYKLMQEHNHD